MLEYGSSRASVHRSAFIHLSRCWCWLCPLLAVQPTAKIATCLLMPKLVQLAFSVSYACSSADETSYLACRSAEQQLEDSILNALEGKGILTQLRSELRLAVCEVIDDSQQKVGEPSVISQRANPRWGTFRASGELVQSRDIQKVWGA